MKLVARIGRFVGRMLMAREGLGILLIIAIGGAASGYFMRPSAQDCRNIYKEQKWPSSSTRG
ncbi:hypothetical protein [Burkholderia phage vB_BglM_WTB]